MFENFFKDIITYVRDMPGSFKFLLISLFSVLLVFKLIDFIKKIDKKDKINIKWRDIVVIAIYVVLILFICLV